LSTKQEKNISFGVLVEKNLFSTRVCRVSGRIRFHAPWSEQSFFDVIWQLAKLWFCEITSLWRQKRSACSMELENECGFYLLFQTSVTYFFIKKCF